MTTTEDTKSRDSDGPGCGAMIAFLIILGGLGFSVFMLARSMGIISTPPPYHETAIRVLAERNGTFRDQIRNLSTEVSTQRGAVVQATIQSKGETGYALLLFTIKDGEHIDQTYWIKTRIGNKYSTQECRDFAKSENILAE